MKNPFSIRSGMEVRKRVFFLLLVVFVPLLLLQAFTFYKWYGKSKEAEMQANLELARTVSKTFAAFINDVLHTQLTIGLAATASPPPSNDSLRRILEAAEELNPMLRSFSWISPAGIKLVTTQTSVENQRIRRESLLPRIVSGEEYGVSDLYDSPYTGEKIFVIGRGIRDPEGSLIGMISCVCVVDKLNPLLAIERSKNSGISVLDSKGTHVYRYPPTKYTPEQMNWLKRYPIIQNVFEGKEATVEVYGSRGEKRLGAFVPIPDIGWVAASSRAEHEVTESITQALLPSAVFMLLVTLAAFWAAVTLSRPISTSIRRLQDHAAALGQGEVERFEMIPGPREIKNLAEAFNDMAQKVRSREQALRESEQNLTSELYAAQRLQQVSTQLIQAEDIEALYNQILDTAVATLHSDFASIQMLYPEHGSGGELRLLGHRGFTEEAAKFWEWVSPSSQSSCGEALRVGHRVVAPDIQKMNLIADSEHMKMYLQTGIRAVQTTPLLSRSGKLLGMISTHWREPHELTPSEMRTLDILARQAADLLERLQAEARLNRDVDALTQMHELSGMILVKGGTQSLLQQVMEAAVTIAGAERGTLQLLEGDSLRMVAQQGHHQDFLEFFASAENRHSVCGEAMMRGERVIVPDVETSALFTGTESLAVLRKAGVRAVQSTPMISRAGALLGVLTTQWGVPYTPNEHDLWRIDLLTRQAADLIVHSQAEEALRISMELSRDRAARLQATLDAAPTIIWTAHDRECRSITGNREAERFSRVPEETNMSKTSPAADRLAHYRVFGDGVELNPEEMPIQRVAASGNPLLDCAIDFVFDDGTIRSLLGNVVPVLDGSGQPCGAIAAFLDNTERRLWEEAVRNSLSKAEEERRVLEAMMEYIPMGITIAEAPDVKIRAVSRFGRELTGKPRHSIEGISVEKHAEAFDVFHSDGVTPATNEELPLTRATKKGEVVREEVWVLGRPDGTKLPILCTAAPIRDSEGHITGGVIGWQDITERKRAEEALMGHRDALEQSVKERTAQLERKNRELQEFAFVASHDLSEPLRKIQTFGDLLKSKGSDHLSEVEKDYIARMAGAANRMQELLDALLRYSRVESKGREFRPARLDNIAKDAAADLEVRIQNIGAHVEIGNLPTIQGDPYQMRQLFQNLIANSLKYYRQEVKPFIRVYGEENDGDYRIYVEDNGIGFDEKYLKKVFEPFQRLHGRNEYQGTGIGLAICKKIVERHSGTITAKSTPGKGSTFIITLPANGIKPQPQ